MKTRSLALVFMAATLAAGLFAQTSQQHWVATWGAAMQPFVNAPPPAPPAGATAVPAPPPIISRFHNQTVRMVAPASIAGGKVRVHFSNAFGSNTLTLGSAHVGIHAKGSGIADGTDRPLTFGGKSVIAIPPGGAVVSDAVDLEVHTLEDLAVSIFVSGEANQPTMHRAALHTTYISPEGDFTGKSTIADASISQSWYWLSSVDVLAASDAGAVVAFGDSITDGARSTLDTDHSWPSLFRQRLNANAGTANVAVVNRGIGGNRVLRDNTGANALSRFDRDVLGTSGVKWMILLEGINDIGQGTRANADPANAVTADEVIAGLRQLLERAHTQGIRVMGATLTPYEGAAYYSESGEAVRQAVNTWIRTGGVFDGVADFDLATRDPQHQLRFKAEFDSGDHLHPGDTGYKAMADAVDVAFFAGKTPGGKAATTSKNETGEKKKSFSEGLSALRRSVSR